jgi:murein L,D-transpeptidase YcbB/YkuD
MHKNRVDLPTGLNDALAQSQLVDWFDGLPPTDIGYTNLSNGYLRYRRLSRAGGWPAFNQGAGIEPGMSDVRIPILIERLVAEGDLSAADGARLKAQGLSTATSCRPAVRGFQPATACSPTPASAPAPSARSAPRPTTAPARSP